MEVETEINQVCWCRMIGGKYNLRIKVGENTFLNILVIRGGNKFVGLKLVRGIYLSTYQTIPNSDLVIPVRDVKKFVNNVLSNYELDFWNTNQEGKEWIERWRQKKTTKV